MLINNTADAGSSPEAEVCVKGKYQHQMIHPSGIVNVTQNFKAKKMGDFNLEQNIELTLSLTLNITYSRAAKNA